MTIHLKYGIETSVLNVEIKQLSVRDVLLLVVAMQV